MSGFWTQQLVGVVFFVLVLVLIALSNWRELRRLHVYAPLAHWPRVSVLVPARNEAANIGPCVTSLLAQCYPDYELVVLNDDSEDGTGQILADMARQNPRLQIIEGRCLPAGWLGKHWACHQLAQAANGELLLFTDADTRHHSDALREAVAALTTEQADLLTVLPQEEVCSWVERLLVPLIHWSIFSFLPLVLVHRWRMPVLSAAVGQFMLFRRQAYEQIGGHAAVRARITDDLALARRIKDSGLRLRLVDGTQRVQCRMYRSDRDVYEGLTKNLFPAFGSRALVFIPIWLWLGFVFIAPLICVVLGFLGNPLRPLAIALSLTAIAGSLLLCGLTYWRFGFPRYLTILYPLSILLTLVVALRSMILTWSRGTTWKGRRLGMNR